MVTILIQRAFRAQGKRNLRLVKWVREEIEKKGCATEEEEACPMQIEEDERLARLEEERLVREEEEEKKRQEEENARVVRELELEETRVQENRAKGKAAQIENEFVVSQSKIEAAVDEMIEELEEEGEDKSGEEEEVSRMEDVMKRRRLKTERWSLQWRNSWKLEL